MKKLWNRMLKAYRVMFGYPVNKTLEVLAAPVLVPAAGSETVFHLHYVDNMGRKTQKIGRVKEVKALKKGLGIQLELCDPYGLVLGKADRYGDGTRNLYLGRILKFQEYTPASVPIPGL